MRRLLARIIFPVLASLLTINTYAATLQVYPVGIGFCAGETAQAVYVKNTGSDTIGAQIRVYAWHQQNNKDVLAETQDVLVSPPMATIPASREQLIRVILPAPVNGSTEQAYRLIVDELPGKSNLAEKDGVRFLLRYSIPVFVNCKHEQPDASALAFSVDSSVHPAMLKVRNNGDRHVKLGNISLVSGSKNILMDKGLLGYVLPHSEKEWPLPTGINNVSSVSLHLNDNEKKQTIILTP